MRASFVAYVALSVIITHLQRRQRYKLSSRTASDNDTELGLDLLAVPTVALRYGPR